MKPALLLACCLGTLAWGQEASSGFELRATVTEAVNVSPLLEAPPRAGERITSGFRSILYPTWKLSEHWTVAGAVQMRSRPYFKEDFSTQGYGLKTDVLNAQLDYSRFWKRGSVVVRLGQMPSAFGSFLLRYDDAVNPLVFAPMAYGYYYKPVSTGSLTGAQVDATLGRLDARAQFANSNPANRRSIFDRDQYPNWAGGAGYSIRQGLRVGVSAYRGPYLDRHYAFYFPGEAKPRDLPGAGYGIDVQWGQGPWNVYGEWQRFQMDYRAIRTFRQHTGYAEVRRVLHPRWYVAARAEYLRANAFQGTESYEVALGYRPNRFQLLKIGYQAQPGRTPNAVAIQFVTSFKAFSID